MWALLVVALDECFPIQDDRRAFFAEKVRAAMPHIGYTLLGQVAEADLFRSLWTTNFDGLVARAAGQFKLTPLEVGIDSQQRLSRPAQRGELLCVSMHGDYRYDDLKNTPPELKAQEAALRAALVEAIADTPLVVCGYSGRDQSIMDTFRDGYGKPGSGVLYWCGFGDGDIPAEVATLIRHARAKGRQAYYIPALGFDDLMTRLALHCLTGDERQAATKLIEEFVPKDKLSREPFLVKRFHATTLIKSNCFPIECPSEMLQFDLKQWPKEKVWSYIRGTVEDELEYVRSVHKDASDSSFVKRDRQDRLTASALRLGLVRLSSFHVSHLIETPAILDLRRSRKNIRTVANDDLTRKA
jgi:hypothetical protein